MKNILILLLFIVSFCSAAAAMPDSIGVETVDGQRFIKHKVAGGEGWYAIARKYGISYAELRMANRQEGDQLKIGQIVRIPAKAKANDPRFQKNYMDTPAVKEADKKQKQEAPKQNKTHRVAAGETLFSIAKKYDVSVDQIKTWNNLKDNNIRKNQELIVGKQDSPGKTKTESAEKIQLNPAPVKSEEIATDPKKQDQKQESNETVLVKTLGNEKARPEEKKYTFSNGRKEVNEQGVASWIDDEDINPNKYYALHRTATVGTIIKITNRMNQKSIFVKVVGRLQETGDNEGLIIKVSKASAEKLGVLDNRFQAELIYGVSER